MIIFVYYLSGKIVFIKNVLIFVFFLLKILSYTIDQCFSILKLRSIVFCGI